MALDNLTLIKNKIATSLALGISDVNQLVGLLKEDKEIVENNLVEYITIPLVKQLTDEIISEIQVRYSEVSKNIFIELAKLDQLYKNAMLDGDFKVAVEIQKLRLKLMQEANLLPGPDDV
jgi:hypothetical protein